MKKFLIMGVILSLFLLTACSGGAPITSFATVNGNVLGGEDAKVRVEIYSDYDCPYCKVAEDDVYQLVEYYGDQIRFEFKDMVVHQSAFKAAEAANCAADQNLFWEYHGVLFENQHENDLADLRSYAMDLGIEMDSFDECLLKGGKTNEVLSDIEDGKSLGIQGTPTYVINEVVYPGAQPFESLKQVINEELNK
jgi:protein-disulfide isomerase